MPTVLLIQSPNSTIPIEKLLVFSQDYLTIGRGIHDIRFAHEPRDLGISQDVLTLKANSEKDGPINAIYHGEEEAFLDGNILSKDEEFQWSGQLLKIRGSLGEYAFLLRNSKASWSFDLAGAKSNFCKISDKSDLTGPILPGKVVNFNVEVSNYKYESNAPDDLWLQPGNSDFPIRFEQTDIPVWNGHDSNPDTQIHKNAKRLDPKTGGSVEPTFSLELSLLIPIGTMAGEHTVELWVCSKLKGYQSLKVDLEIAPEYTFTSSFEPIGDVEKTSENVPYLKPGHPARLTITSTANIEQILLLDWVAKQTDKSGNTKTIHPLAGLTKTIERKLYHYGEQITETPDLRWQRWLDRPWLIWPFKDEKLVELKISSGAGNQKTQDHPFMFKKAKWKGTTLSILSIVFLFYCLVFPWLDRRYHPNTEQIGVLNNPYGAGTPVVIYVTNPTNITSLSFIESETPIPLATIGLTQESEFITTTYALSTTQLTPSNPIQIVELEISSNFGNPLDGQPWPIDCDSWIALLFCTKAKKEATIEFKQALDKCTIQLENENSPRDCNSQLKYLAKFKAQNDETPKSGYPSLTFKIAALQTQNGNITVRDEVNQTNLEQNDKGFKVPSPIAFTSLDPTIDSVSFYTYTIAIGDSPIQSVTITVVRPIVITNKDKVELYEENFTGSQQVSSSTPLLALSKPNTTSDGELIKVWYQSRNRWVNKNDVNWDFEIGDLPDEGVPPTPTSTPTLTPEPTNTPTPTSTETPTPIPAIEFNLVEPSGKKMNNPSTKVEIFICVCRSDGNLLDGYSLKLTKPDGVPNILEVKSISTTLPAYLEPQTWKFNMKFAQDFVVGTWWVQLMKDGYPVSEPTSYDFVAGDAANGKLPWLYLRYCKGGTC